MEIKMIKKWMIVLFVALTPTQIFGVQYLIQMRAGYCNFFDHSLRSSFTEDAIDGELELMAIFCHRYGLWTNVNYLQQNGDESKNPDSRLQLGTVSVGLKYMHPLLRDVAGYVGGGVVGSWTEANQLNAHSKDYGLGGVVKFGVLCCFGSCLVLDVFTDYYYLPVKIVNDTMNAGGIRAGAGLGVRF
jgi:hypothetical protein